MTIRYDGPDPDERENSEKESEQVDPGESLPYDLEGNSASGAPAAERRPVNSAVHEDSVEGKDRDFTARIVRWRTSGDETELTPLIDEFTRRIERQASRHTQRGLDQSDVMEAGYTALASTLKEFNTDIGVPFGVLFARHFGAKIKEQRAQLEGAMALRRKTYQVRSNVLIARDAVRKEQVSASGIRSAGYKRDRDVERFSLPSSFDDTQFAALFDASGAGGEPQGPSDVRAEAWASLFVAVADHYCRVLPDAPVATLERAATAKTVPIASAPPVSRSAMERALADAIDYDITMFARRGEEYDPAPSRERSTAMTREFYEAVAKRSGTTPDRARALLESFGSTQSFDATPDSSGGKKVGPALGARLTTDEVDTVDEEQVEPIVHGLHLVPTVSRVAFVLHTGLDGFRPLPLPQLAHDCGISQGQAERLVDGAREVFANPAVREAIFDVQKTTTAAAARAKVALTAAKWHSEREATRTESIAASQGDERVSDAAATSDSIAGLQGHAEMENEPSHRSSMQFGMLL